MINKSPKFPPLNLEPMAICQKIPDKLKELMLDNADSYNDEQKKAIIAKGSIYVEAVAGCGKTRTLSGCAARKVFMGTPPKKLAVCSFTTEASSEIKNRTNQILHKILGEENREDLDNEIISGTIHSIGLREIKEWGFIEKSTTVIGGEKQQNTWKEAVQFAKAKAITDNQMELYQELCSCYDYLRNLGITAEESELLVDLIWEKGITNEKEESIKASTIVQNFKKIKQNRNQIDYTDILILWEKLVDISPDYKNRWDCILVDEFQDTSPLQQRIIKKIHDKGADIIACGDPNQCITSFNGSDPEEQERLVREITKQKLRLVTNYRSDKTILALSNQVLLGCETQPEFEEKLQLKPRENAPEGIQPIINITKTIYAENAGIQLEEANIHDCINQALNVHNDLKAFIPNPKVALLYRNNKTGDKLEECALKFSAQNPGGTSFERKDRKKEASIKKLEKELAQILTWWTNPSGSKGNYLLTEILKGSYFPGMGEKKATTTVNNIKQDISNYSDTWKAFNQTIPDRNVGHMGYLLTAWETAVIRTMVERDDPAINITCKAAAQALREFITKVNEFEMKYYKTDQDKLENKHKYEENFLNKLEQYGNKSLLLVLQNKTFLNTDSTQQSIEEDEYNGIILSTIHLSKGKEYDAVVIHDIAHGKLPHSKAISDESYNQLGQLGVKSLANIIKALGGVTKAKKEAITNILKQKIEEIQLMDTEDLRQTNRNTRICNPLEEEKRLMYVGMTRARHILIMQQTDIKPYQQKDDEIKTHQFIPKKAWNMLNIKIKELEYKSPKKN